MQDPVVIMNFTHIYEDETFYISEQKSSAPRSGEASPAPATGSGIPAPVRAASPAPSIVPGSPAPALSTGSGIPTSVRAASPAPAIVPGSPAPALSTESGIPAPARVASLKPCILDFTTLSGTNGFCDDAAADEIRRRIADFPARGLHFLDNGNYHYLTRFWCEKITEDFALVVYDHHVDLRKPVFPGLMSCGSWIRDVLLRNSHCRAVFIIGPERAQADIIERELQSLADEDNFSAESVSGTASEPRMIADSAVHDRTPNASDVNHPAHTWTFVRPEADDQCSPTSASARVSCFTEDDILDGRAARELPHILDELRLPVYISIDKDVLSRKVLRTNWDQGIMTEAEFRHELDRFTTDPEIHILGADICGEPTYNACRRILDDTRDLRRSDGVNHRLLEHYLARMP